MEDNPLRAGGPNHTFYSYSSGLISAESMLVLA